MQSSAAVLTATLLSCNTGCSVVTVETVLFDTDLTAFAVGAVTPNSVIKCVLPAHVHNKLRLILIHFVGLLIGSATSIISLAFGGMTSEVSGNIEQASSIAWVESALDVKYSFQSQGDLASGVPPYIIPVPAELPTTTTARWLTDVVKLNPSCVWPKINLSQPITSTGNFSNFTTIAVNIPDFNVDVSIDASAASMQPFFLTDGDRVC